MSLILPVSFTFKRQLQPPSNHDVERSETYLGTENNGDDEELQAALVLSCLPSNEFDKATEVRFPSSVGASVFDLTNDRCFKRI